MARLGGTEGLSPETSPPQSPDHSRCSRTRCLNALCQLIVVVRCCCHVARQSWCLRPSSLRLAGHPVVAARQVSPASRRHGISSFTLLSPLFHHITALASQGGRPSTASFWSRAFPHFCCIHTRLHRAPGPGSPPRHSACSRRSHPDCQLACQPRSPARSGWISLPRRVLVCAEPKWLTALVR